MLRITNARHRLPAVLGTGLLVMLALGVMIGGGIFSLAGTQAATMAGPAVIVSFIIAAVVSLLAALSYAELSSTLPTAGSAYTFAYVAFGEVWAWIVGWALVLELVVAAAVVSRIWASYFTATLDGFDIGIPQFFADHSQVAEGTGWIAAILVVVLMLLVMTGGKLTGRVLASIVTAKLVAVVLVIAVGATHVKSANYTPFVPKAQAVEGGSHGPPDAHRCRQQLRRSSASSVRREPSSSLSSVSTSSPLRPRTPRIRGARSRGRCWARSASSRSCMSRWPRCSSVCGLTASSTRRLRSRMRCALPARPAGAPMSSTSVHCSA